MFFFLLDQADGVRADVSWPGLQRQTDLAPNDDNGQQQDEVGIWMVEKRMMRGDGHTNSMRSIPSM